MVEGAGGAPLGEQTALPVRVRRCVRVQELDGDVALESRIPPLNTTPMPPSPMRPTMLVRPDAIADHGRCTHRLNHAKSESRSDMRGEVKPSSIQMSDRALASEVRKP